MEDSEKKARTGSPVTVTRVDKGLSTYIDKRDRDAYGNKLSPTQRAGANNLRKWQLRIYSQSSEDRNLSHALRVLDRLASQIGFQRAVKEHSALIYRQVIEKCKIRGHSIEAMVAASIYIAIRIMKISYTLDKFAKNTKFDKWTLARYISLILKELKIRLPERSSLDLINAYGRTLSLSYNSQQIALKILESAKKCGITSGKDPKGLTAAALYIALIKSGEFRSQKEISKVANVTEITIRNRYKQFVNVLKICLA